MQQDVQHINNLVNNVLLLNVGEDTSFDNTEYYDQIIYLKREDDNLEKGIWDRPLIEPKWKEIIQICQERLKIGPDLIIGARYTEACAGLYQLEGFLAGMIVIQQICNKSQYVPLDITKRELTIEWINNKLKNNLYLIHTLLKHKGITKKDYEINNYIIEICKALPFSCGNILQLSENFKLSSETINAYQVEDNQIIEETSADFIEQKTQIQQNLSINNNIKNYIDGELSNIKEDLSNISKNLNDLISNIKDKNNN